MKRANHKFIYNAWSLNNIGYQARKFVLIALPLLFFLLSLPPSAEAQTLDIFPSPANIRGASKLTISWGAFEGTNPSSYEARLGSGGQWNDVGSQVWQGGSAFFYTFTGLQPNTEYTLSIRATGNGNTGAAISETMRTLTADEEFDLGIGGSCGKAKILLSGINSPGNAPFTFEVNAEVFPGQGSSSIRTVRASAAVDKTVTEIDGGELAPGERLFVEMSRIRTENPDAPIVRRFAQIFGDDLQSCSSPSSTPEPPTTQQPKQHSEQEPEPSAPPPTVYTLNHLPPGIQVNHWVEGAQGRRVDHVAVARADLVEQGILDAVDVWGYVTPGVEVCFSQLGRLVFLDAAFAPRKLSALGAYQRAGWTCGRIDSAGTVVLMRSDEAPPAPQLGQPQSGCQVKPLANLNFRQSPPDGPIIDVIWMRYSTALAATAKQAGYFKVSYNGLEGWVSAEYVSANGSCAA